MYEAWLPGLCMHNLLYSKMGLGTCCDKEGSHSRVLLSCTYIRFQDHPAGLMDCISGRVDDLHVAMGPTEQVRILPARFYHHPDRLIILF